MRQFIERLLQTVDPPDPERAERLWAEYQAGGPKADAAFATLMAWYGGPLYRRIWGFVRSDAAEDVFQDVLVRLHRRRLRFTGFEHALRWLRGVAVTQSLNARRGEVRRTSRERIRAVAGGIAINTAEAAELREALRAALAKLPDREREAVALVYFEGMTRQNGAAALGVHRDTMTKLLESALGRLKSALAATAIGAALTTAGVETALAANPGLPIARLTVLTEAAWVNARGSGFSWPPARKLVPWILVGGLVAVAAAATLTWSGFMARSPNQPVRLQVDRLEPREVPSADFVSALGLTSQSGVTSGVGVATDAVGNRYVTGSLSKTVDFDPAGSRPGDTDILTSAGQSDVYVAKYAPDDSLVWVTRMGGTDQEIGAAIAVDGGGNVFVTGPFKGSANFGSTTLTSVDSDDGYIAKLDSAGSVVWARRWGQVGIDQGRGVDTDAAGNVYVVGYRTGVSDLPDGGFEIMKWNSNGDTSWTVFLNSTMSTLFCDLVVDASGNVFVTGTATAATDFDPAPNKTKTLANGGAFVLKLATTGGFGWVSNLSGGIGSDLTLDASGNVLVAGTYSGTPKFSQYGARTQNLPTGLTATGRDFVAKLNSSGGLVWAKQVDSNADRNISNVMWGGVAADAAGNVYLTGNFSGTIDFNPGAGTHSKTSVGGNDAFVLKLTSAGNFAWADTFGGTGNDSGGDITVDSSGIIHMTGNYSGTVDFDPDPNVAFDLTNQGSIAHMFLVKLRSN